MSVVFITDPLESLNAATDTSIGLMRAAQNRDLQVWVTEAHLLEAVHGRARALARRLRLAASSPPPPSPRRYGRPRAVASTWYETGEPRHVWLDEMTAVFMRTEPPLDKTYLTATLVLDLVDPAETVMVNDPRGLRACAEHILPLHYPDLIPPTIVTADPDAIRSFLAEHDAVVVKPVDGFGGRGVLRLHSQDPNLASLLETSTHDGRRAVIAQRFLPEVSAGNKRIFMVAGEPVGAVYRYQAPGDFRIGDPAAQAPVTSRDREICARLEPDLRRHGIRLAGLDVIGPHLIEVNVTSVGALRKADILLGWSLCADLVDSVLGTHEQRGIA